MPSTRTDRFATTRRRIIAALESTDSLRPLGRRIGRLRVGQWCALAFATLIPLGTIAPWFALAMGQGTTSEAIAASLAFAEVPGLLLLGALLWCSPLTALTGRTFLRQRKWFGLGFAACSVMNLVAFLVGHPISHMQRAFAIIATLSVVLLVPLAATSNRWSIRRLGRARWQQLHRLVYLVAVAVAVHLYLVPQDDGPAGNITTSIVVGVSLLVRHPRFDRWIRQLRQRRGGSLLSVRTWLA